MSQEKNCDIRKINLADRPTSGLTCWVSRGEFAKIFADRLRFWMAKRGMNQVELARASGVSQPSISNYLNQVKSALTPSPENLYALAKALHCTMEQLSGLAVLHGIEEKLEQQIQPTDKELAILEAYRRLPEGSPERQIIDKWLLYKDKLSDESTDNPGEAERSG